MNRRLASGFLIGLAVFVLINLLSAHLASDCGLPALFGRDPCADDIARAGWPLRFYEEGGLDYRRTFDPSALALDLVLAGVMSAGFGWLLTRHKSTRNE